MDFLRTLAMWSFSLLLISLFAVVALKIAQRRALSAGLSRLRAWRSGFVVAVTLLIAIVYGLLVVRSADSLPAVPKPLLLLVAVSNGIYLAPRLHNFFSRPATTLRSTR